MRPMQSSLRLLTAVAAFGCRAPDPLPPPDTFAEPTDAPGLRGRAPAALFDQSELMEPCAFLEGSAGGDGAHHTAAAYRGHLVLPWAVRTESYLARGGSLDLYELESPCEPTLVGSGSDPAIGATTAIGLAHLREDDDHAGDWAVTSHVGTDGELGVRIWDLSAPESPAVVAALELPDVPATGPGGLFWQFPWLWVAAGSHGVYLIDTTDPTSPVIAGQTLLGAGLVADELTAIGNLLLVTGVGSDRATFLDISDPLDPIAIAGGTFTVTDATGTPEATLGATLVGDHVAFSRYEGGGGVLMWEVSDPGAPAWAGEIDLPDTGGGRIAAHDGYLLMGSSTTVNVLEVRDPTDPDLDDTAELTGIVEALVPWGNIALATATSGANHGESTAILPWTQQPDTTGPDVLRIDPPDGATGVAPTARLGIAFNEAIEPSSVFAGSIRLYAEDETPIEGWGNAQGTIASYTPYKDLVPGTRYRIEIRAEGVTDVLGNPVAATVTSTFTTAD
jgi:hypothetical protein